MIQIEVMLCDTVFCHSCTECFWLLVIWSVIQNVICCTKAMKQKAKISDLECFALIAAVGARRLWGEACVCGSWTKQKLSLVLWGNINWGLLTSHPHDCNFLYFSFSLTLIDTLDTLAVSTISCYDNFVFESMFSVFCITRMRFI